ncbi:DUF4178 domain-containing protein [Mycolicibacterium sp. YH-1]|uniref:DUF4178 domain-containing protein n=1 Tax=Mycolicibacterium sp. YH-1 TaxID=2908837 RepID=UPI001F4C2348|nr:DUF4178 domain-containing protein [Mycolicibacterium sp. YH-1]UNB50522.1 DUF4178 domain-containing protein [Mycolicibacterium sp. YH-1]
MGELLIIVAIVLLVAAVGVAVIAFRRPKTPKAPVQRQDPLKFGEMPRFGPRELGPGAIVSHGGVDYVVRGSVTLRQGPFVWWEHLLEGGGGEPLWFSVEEDEGRLELATWTRRSDLRLEPGGEHLVDGVRFRESERGRASYTTEGTTGLPAGGDVDFVDYAGDDETLLLGFERWADGMPWEISLGRTVLPGELTVYPAPPAGT